MLLAHDIPVSIASEPIPTQMTSYEVVEHGFACGVMITASHNPWTDNGFKVKSPTGAAAGPEILATLERTIRDGAGTPPPRRPYADALAAGKVELFDPFEGYRRFLERSLDLEPLRAADLRVLVDPMWGSGAGWIPRLLAGGRIQVTEIHSERNPWFGGVNPEPIRPNIDEALALLAAGGYDLGLLLDGDADRAGAADEQGDVHPPARGHGPAHVPPAGAPRHATSRWSRPSTRPSMVFRLGEMYGVPVHETSVGFKFVGPKMIETGAMMGGEESGGYGFGMHLPERDGIYADLMLLDLFIREKAAGRWPVSAAVAHMHDIAGPSFYLRRDVHADRAAYPALKDSAARGAARARARVDRR